jgi:hypothetical protein
MEEIKQLVIREDTLGEKVADGVVNFVPAALGLIPIAGNILGPLASIVAAYHTPARQQRIEDAIESMVVEFNNVWTTLDQDYLKSSEFQYIFEESLSEIARTQHQLKIDALKKVVLNSAIKKDVAQTTKEYYLRLTAQLSDVHLRMLSFFCNPETFIDQSGVSRTKITGGFGQFMPLLFPDVPIPIQKNIVQELKDLDLINSDKSIYSTMTSASGMRLVTGRSALLGIDYLKFITE